MMPGKSTIHYLKMDWAMISNVLAQVENSNGPAYRAALKALPRLQRKVLIARADGRRHRTRRDVARRFDVSIGAVIYAERRGLRGLIEAYAKAGGRTIVLIRDGVRSCGS